MTLGPGVWFDRRTACRSDRVGPPRTSAVVLTLNTAGTTRDSSASRDSRVPRRGAGFGCRTDVADPAAVAVAVARTGDAALVRGGGSGVVAAVDGRAARQQRLREGGAAVVLQPAQPREHRLGGGAHLVVVLVVGEAVAGGVRHADEVEAQRGERPVDVEAVAGAGRVAGDEGV